jgi:hypothetical protein
VRLRAILEQPEAPLRAEPADAVEIGGMPVEVHRHEADRAGRDLGRGVPHVDRVGIVHVHEDRHRAREADRLHGGEGGVGRHEHLVVGLDPERLQRHPERGGRAAREHRVLAARVAGELLLERARLRPEDVLPRVDGGQDRGLDLVVDRRARERDGHDCSREYLPRK